MERMLSKKEQIAALKDEMRFYKIVLGFKSPALKLTQPLPELTRCLKAFFDEQQPLASDNLPLPSDETDEQNEPDVNDGFLFTFTRTGQHVAVFYDSTFHIGDVIKVFDEDQGEISFMKKSVINNNTYVWPQQEDRETIDNMFVFAWDFDVTTTNGRIWTVCTPQNTPTLQERYVTYKTKFC